MQPLLFQLSGISALLMLLSQLWSDAPLERTLVLTVGVGATVYSVLLIVQAVLRYALTPPSEAPEPDGSEAPQESESGG